MKIRFKQDYHTEVAIQVDKDDEPDFEPEFFEAGDTHEVDILKNKKGCIDIQFGEGYVAYKVPKHIIEKIG